MKRLYADKRKHTVERNDEMCESEFLNSLILTDNPELPLWGTKIILKKKYSAQHPDMLAVENKTKR